MPRRRETCFYYTGEAKEEEGERERYVRHYLFRCMRGRGSSPYLVSQNEDHRRAEKCYNYK